MAASRNLKHEHTALSRRYIPNKNLKKIMSSFVERIFNENAFVSFLIFFFYPLRKSLSFSLPVTDISYLIPKSSNLKNIQMLITVSLH